MDQEISTMHEDQFVSCPKCGHKHKIFDNIDGSLYKNICGRICMNCGFLIEPEVDCREILKNKSEKIKNEIREYLKSKEL